MKSLKELFILCNRSNVTCQGEVLTILFLTNPELWKLYFKAHCIHVFSKDFLGFWSIELVIECKAIFI